LDNGSSGGSCSSRSRLSGNPGPPHSSTRRHVQVMVKIQRQSLYVSSMILCHGERGETPVLSQIMTRLNVSESA
jgi:hypothetical protein